MEELDTKEEFSILKRARSFSHAMRGLRVFIRTTHNAWIHILALVAVIVLGFIFEITKIEWLVLILAAGLVFTAESFNTAIEIDINLTSPQYHPYAKDTKDVAAGAVLLASITALIIGVLVFIPYVLTILHE